jgi:hypothetical protein
MTQICPGLGVAPVPTWVSVIWRPEDVVMGFPTACAVAVVGAWTANAPANAMTKAKAASGFAREKARINSPPWGSMAPD